MRVEALVAGDDTIAEEPLLGVQDMSDAGSVGLGAHGEHVQLVEGGDLLQELAGVGSQPTVVDHRVAGQAKAIHVLAAVRKKIIKIVIRQIYQTCPAGKLLVSCPTPR